MSCDSLSAVSQLFGYDLPGGSVRIAIHGCAAADRRIRPRQASIALVGILMPQSVARDAIVARDAAGAHCLVLVILLLSELALRIPAARGSHRTEGLRPIEQRTLFRQADRLHPIPPALGAVSDAEIDPLVGIVRAKLHRFPGSQPEGELQSGSPIRRVRYSHPIAADRR